MSTNRFSPARRRLLQGAVATGALSFMSDATHPASAPLLTRPIPRNRESLPVVGIGTWQTFDVGPRAPERVELSRVLRRFAALGGRVVDSSPMYGQSERTVGDLTAELGLRDTLFFATKVWTSGRDAGIRQMEDSLRLMRAGTMDLMQVHNLLDLDVHARTLREWKASGRVRYIGVTHYHAGAHEALERIARSGDWDFVQINYSLAEPEAGARLLPACADAGVAVIINRPFAGSGLFRSVRGRQLPAWAAEFDCTSWAQFFLKWIVAHPAVTCAIPGTSRLTHLEDNLRAATGRLPDAATRERMAKLVAG